MAKFAFQHVGPTIEETIEVPAPQGGTDYFLVHDPDKRTLVYGISSDYHQGGKAWTFDGTAFTPLSKSAYRLGSQNGKWMGVYDRGRKAVVAWAFDYDSGPYGVVVGEKLSVILHTNAVEDHERMSQEAQQIVVTGDMPSAPEDGSWDDLIGVIGYDAKRNVTVCLTQGGIYELDDTAWKRVADAPSMPGQVSGDRNHFSNGAGAVWDAARNELVFHLHDGDVDTVAFVAWDGRTAKKLEATGLPKVWGGFSDDESGYAIGDHPEHGVILYAGPNLGMYARTDDGWDKLGAGTDAPPRGKGGHMAFDATRGAIVLGPYITGGGEQAVLHEQIGTKWKRHGASRTKSALADLSSGFQAFGKHRGVMHAVGLYMKTVAWDPQKSWQWILDDAAGDKARDGKRVHALVTAWEGALHAIMDDGSVMTFDGTTFTQRSGKSTTFKDPQWPLSAFDEKRGVIVAWGSKKKSGGRKNDTWLFEKGVWTKAKKATAKPADIGIDDLDAFALFYDTAKQQVARLGKTELAHFDGVTWTPTKLGGAEHLETWRRAVCHKDGATLVVNCGQKTIAKIEDGKVTKLGALETPATRDQHQNLPFDRWWFDDEAGALVVHNDIDDAQSFALDLRSAF